MRRMPEVRINQNYLMHKYDDAGTRTRIKRKDPEEQKKEIEEKKRMKELEKQIERERQNNFNSRKTKQSSQWNAMTDAAREERRTRRQQGDLIDMPSPRNRSYKEYQQDVNRQRGYGRMASAAKDHELEQRDRVKKDNLPEEIARRGRNIERSARKNIQPSKNVPSQNPTAGGGTAVIDGKERANHKYVKKVRTKSGKIRYIYDDSVTTASGKHIDPKKAYDSQRHAKHVTNKAAYMDAWKRREASENAQRQRNADPINQARKFANRTINNITKTAGNVMNNARNFMKQFGIG